MSSRRSARHLVVAVMLGVLVGGGLMAVTPAGAQVSQAAATSWKKIWKKELKPLADKRYYTKAQSDTAFQQKGAYAAAGSSYTKAESYSKGETYSKAETYSRSELDTKLAPLINSVAATAGGDQTLSLTNVTQVVRSVSLMPPANGTVIVSSSGQVEFNAAGAARCSISRTTGLDGDAYQVVSGAAGAYATVAGTRGFTVTKGALLTVNLVCDQFSGTETIRDTALTAIFAPS
ncbi:hypothetical protein [Nocardioides hwasunensis]|uniref:Uncharacterized protein n=1 Tax=Nocardioides hwasunensis TaxID=397258 RepID=A0ABR8MJC9_9ACTN|nr:hypothetical protein [Nocardioides hwasunensis]MBD3915171.1 hypothetical protein [Nocardioides hwasunensis]